MLIKVSIHQEYIRIKNICNRKIMGRWQSCKHQKTVSPPRFWNNFGTLQSIEGLKISKGRPHHFRQVQIQPRIALSLWDLVWMMMCQEIISILIWGASQVVIVARNPPANSRDIRDTGSIPGSRSPGVESGNPLQYSCLGNSMDREAWWATVHGAQSRYLFGNSINTSVSPLNLGLSLLLPSLKQCYLLFFPSSRHQTLWGTGNVFPLLRTKSQVKTTMNSLKTA